MVHLVTVVFHHVHVCTVHISKLLHGNCAIVVDKQLMHGVLLDVSLNGLRCIRCLTELSVTSFISKVSRANLKVSKNSRMKALEHV